MKILQRETVWIHTHFITDCVYLADHHAREIRDRMDRVLAEHRIVFGIHFDTGGDRQGLRIVLECVPLPETMRSIESALAEIIEPMPARPRRTRVEIEPSARRAAPDRR